MSPPDNDPDHERDGDPGEAGELVRARLDLGPVKAAVVVDPNASLHGLDRALDTLDARTRDLWRAGQHAAADGTDGDGAAGTDDGPDPGSDADPDGDDSDVDATGDGGTTAAAGEASGETGSSKYGPQGLADEPEARPDGGRLSSHDRGARPRRGSNGGDRGGG